MFLKSSFLLRYTLLLGVSYLLCGLLVLRASRLLSLYFFNCLRHFRLLFCDYLRFSLGFNFNIRHCLLFSKFDILCDWCFYLFHFFVVYLNGILCLFGSFLEFFQSESLLEVFAVVADQLLSLGLHLLNVASFVGKSVFPFKTNSCLSSLVARGRFETYFFVGLLGITRVGLDS